eukprot:575318-Hanusia_phi.AAC.1
MSRIGPSDRTVRSDHGGGTPAPGTRVRPMTGVRSSDPITPPGLSPGVRSGPIIPDRTRTDRPGHPAAGLRPS